MHSHGNPWNQEMDVSESHMRYRMHKIDEKIIRDCNFEELPVNIKHIMALKDLPNHHNDPFDRLLICQSIVEKAPLLTEDKLIEKYKITV